MDGLLAFLLAMALMIGFLYQSLTKSQFEQLKNEVTLIAKGVELNGEGYLKQLDFDVTRVTLITKDGQVVYDSLRQAVQENHLSRDEVQQALQTGYGESIRYSKTLTQNMLYVAKLMDQGYILRVSIAQQTVLFAVFSLLPWLLLALLILVFLSIVVSRMVSQKL